MQEALLDINQNESMFEILDEIELGCNFIDMTEDEEYSDIEITTLKKTGEEQEANIQPKYQRYRTSESNKIKQHLLNLTYLGNDDQLSPLPDQQKSSPSRQVLFSEKQNSSHSLSSRQSDQLHIQTQQKKSLMAPVVSQANNQEEEKKAASDLESSQSSSDSSSQSSDSSKVTSQKMSTNNSFGEGKKNNKDQLQMKQFINFNLPNEKKEEDVKSPFNKMSLIQIKQIETDKSAVQSSNIFNFAPNSNKINSQTRLPSKITQELDKVDERGIQIQQPNSLKNFEKKEIGDAVLTRQLSNNINVANKQSSIIINDFQQAQQQTDNQRNQTFDKFKIGRVIVNSQFGSRRTMRETKAGNQLELIQQSVIAFLNQQQQKKSKIFNDIVDNQQIKKLQALTNLGKNQQDNKQATNKSIVVPSFLNPLQVEENPVKLEQKIQEIIEPPDQVNYTMLQTFDKAKIFKFYNPHFNYLEIVKKWIILQNKFQKIYFQNKRSLPKKKARHQKSKRKFQEF